jgi:oligoribonuclease
MPETTHLAWVDLETTGSDERHDHVIEIGFILTDIDLNVIDEFQSVIQPDALLPSLIQQMVPVVREMHEANGLLNELRSGYGTSIYEADRTIVSILVEHGVERHAGVIAGSGVGHFDRRFVKHHMKKLDRHLAYPAMDVGVVRRFVRDVMGVPLPEFDAAKTGKSHRAMSDIRLHLGEAKWFRSSLAVMEHAAKLEVPGEVGPFDAEA